MDKMTPRGINPVPMALAAAFGSSPSLETFGGASGTHRVSVLSCADVPLPGVLSYGTVGLSAHPARLAGEERKDRVEIVGACRKGFPDFAAMLASCAFSVIEEGAEIGGGIVFMNVMSIYGISKTMDHVLMVAPFAWEMPRISAGGRPVTFLMALPVSESERRYAWENGPDALEEILEAAGIDAFDPGRPPAV